MGARSRRLTPRRAGPLAPTGLERWPAAVPLVVRRPARWAAARLAAPPRWEGWAAAGPAAARRLERSRGARGAPQVRSRRAAAEPGRAAGMRPPVAGWPRL